MTDNKTDETDAPWAPGAIHGPEFRSDLEEFVRREAVEACISKHVMS